MLEPNEPISVTKAEIKLLEALIELEEEERAGAADSITVFDSEDALALWAKVGKWAWKNRYKLVAAGEALYDLLGGVFDAQALADGDVPDEIRVLLSRVDETSLDDLLRARDEIYRAIDATPKDGRKR
jgi:hypothetical protein